MNNLFSQNNSFSGSADNRVSGTMQLCGAGWLQGFTSSNQPYTRHQGRIMIRTGRYPITSLKLPLIGWNVGGNFVKTNLPKTYTISFAIERVDGTQVTASQPILYGGSSSVAVTAGNSFISDDWCTINGGFASDERFWLRWDVNVPTSGILFYTGTDAAIGGPWTDQSTGFTTNTPINSVTDIGLFSATGGTSLTVFPPACYGGLIATYQYQKTAALLIGDSKTSGAGSLTDGLSGRSATWRAMFDFSVPTYVAAIAGSTLQAAASLSSSAWWMAAYVTDVFIQLAVNDLTGARTLTNLQTDLNTLITNIKVSNPAARFWVAKCEPHTISTDSWTTVANQTFFDAATTHPTGTRNAWNAWLDTQVGTLLFGVLDPNVAVEAGGSNQTGKWAVYGSATASTGDGLHEAENAHAILTGAYENQLLRKGFIPNTGYGS
jgi:hypothetical protein